jgi:thymidylate synthase
MEQYLKLLKDIKEKGTYKPPAREGMPGTQSLFGYQFRHNLADGFPLLTTKKVAWKSVVTELLWFLRGDTNIKYLVDNGCNIWNEDAYNYYLKLCKQQKITLPIDFIDFIKVLKGGFVYPDKKPSDYEWGDCGFQYGKVWRNWETYGPETDGTMRSIGYYEKYRPVDQIANVIKSLKETPESRRHIVTAIDPAHDTDLALYWCHAIFQFNCRPLTLDERTHYWFYNNKPNRDVVDYFDDHFGGESAMKELDKSNVPRYYLDCQLYQRSADVVLGVPFNIASYSLLIRILCKICNMIPGEFIHTFGDVHIYDNHIEAVEEQLSREPRELPSLFIDEEVCDAYLPYLDFNSLTPQDFLLENYNPHPAIKAELSTGLKK